MTTLRKIAREEVRTGLVWAALGAIGWTAISAAIDSRFFGTDPVERAAVVAVLSLVTGLVITLPILGVRLVTGEDLSALRPGRPLFRVLAGALLSGFVLLYLGLVLGLSPVVLPLYGVVVAAVLWRTDLGQGA